MDFALSQTQRLYRSQLRDYVGDVMIGESINWDAENFPHDVWTLSRFDYLNPACARYIRGDGKHCRISNEMVIETSGSRRILPITDHCE